MSSSHTYILLLRCRLMKFLTKQHVTYNMYVPWNLYIADVRGAEATGGCHARRAAVVASEGCPKCLMRRNPSRKTLGGALNTKRNPVRCQSDPKYVTWNGDSTNMWQSHHCIGWGSGAVGQPLTCYSTTATCAHRFEANFTKQPPEGGDGAFSAEDCAR